MQRAQGRIHRIARGIRRTGLAAASLAILCVLYAGGCALNGGSGCEAPPASLDPGVEEAQRDAEIYRRAEIERTRILEAEVERLRAELRDAEGAVLAIESGLTGDNSRADAVAAAAAARVQLERARRAAAWHVDAITEAEQKLSEADRQIEAGSFGAAIFFASRADRVSARLLGEAERTEGSEHLLHVRRDKVNLRQGPSLDHRVLTVLRLGTPVIEERREQDWVLVRTALGRVGWVHGRLLGRK